MNASPTKRGPVILTLGTFDGVHRGHQALLARAAARARSRGGRVLAAAFSRPPRLYFRPLLSPVLLSLPEEKEDLLRRYGADRVETLNFGPELARLSAEGFFQRWVLKRWRASEVVAGFNFCFGRERAGNTAFLRREGRREGVDVSIVGPRRLGREVVSSGTIRPLLAAGRVAEANRLLGHPHLLIAPVVRGRGLGRKLGYPTANLRVPPEKALPPGVSVVRVTVPTGPQRLGLCNVGHRPTVGGGLERSVEVHILDFTGRLVGHRLRVEFLDQLRRERKFPSLKALTAQIARDERRARSRWSPTS